MTRALVRPPGALTSDADQHRLLDQTSDVGDLVGRVLRAVVDGGLTFNGAIIEIGTDSCRLASTRARAEEPAKAG